MSTSLSNFEISSGTIEGLKWLAVILMTVDHINLQLLGSAVPIMYNLGRVSLPLFVLILAYNLARPETEPKENTKASVKVPTKGSDRVFMSVLMRLSPIAIISSLPYLELNYATFGFFPLNILFTLGVGIFIIAWVNSMVWWEILIALSAFYVCGHYVDYGWLGIGVFVCAWFFFKKRDVLTLLALTISIILLGVFCNHNQWALLVFPIGIGAMWVRLPIPRIKNALYYYYPVHLVVLAILKTIYVP